MIIMKKYMMKYNPSLIEKKWQDKWSELNTFKAKIDYTKLNITF